jgi:hypothetical protein
MSRRITVVLITACAALAAVPLPSSATVPRSALPTHVNSCWSSDNGAPVLDSFTTSTTSVDVTDRPATVGITVHAHDVGGPGPAHPLGDRLRLQVYVPRATDVDITDTHPLTLLKSSPGTWTGSWTVPRNAPAAPFRFNWLSLNPSQGPRASLQYEKLGPDATIDVTSAHPDTTPPDITDFGISPGTVDLSHGAGRVHVSATVSDGTGVSEVTVLVGHRVVSLHGGTTPDHYTGVFTTRPWEPRPNLPLQVFASDVNDVSAGLTSADLADAGLPSTLTVRGSHPDHRGPRLSGFSLSSHRLHLRPDGWLTVRVHAADLGSRVRSVSLGGLVGPSSGTLARPGLPNRSLHLVSGTRRHGVWSLRVHVRCVPSPSLSRVRVVADDVAGNRTVTSRQRLRITGPDRTAPQGDDLDGGGFGRATVTFSEPVHGISTTSVQVSEHGDPPFLAGSWQCWSRRYFDIPTSCRYGHVLTATFTATDPDAEITHMDFAPNRHLGVLDRAGNPLLLESDAD